MSADQRRSDLQDRTADIQSDIVENRGAALEAATATDAAFLARRAARFTAPVRDTHLTLVDRDLLGLADIPPGRHHH